MTESEDLARHHALLAQAPELADQLRPDERLMHVHRIPHRVPPAPLSAIRSLTALTPQAGRRALNRSGPVSAAGTVPRSANEPDVPPHLRLFEALFGRDSLTCARILLPWYPGLAQRTVLALARVQGTDNEVASEEEPGRIPHEVRDPSDPVARRITAEAGWAWPYYGSIDATCLWIMLAVALGAAHRGFMESPVERRDGRTVPLIRCLVDAVGWLLGRLDASGSGLLESAPRFPGSIENQVWKDSWDAYTHADGTIATPGTVASIEVQALAHDALRAAAEVRDARYPGGVGALRRAAEVLQERILTDFWIGGGNEGFFALGLDRDALGRSRAMAVKSSNMGHLLLSGVLDSDDPRTRRRREMLVSELMAPDMLCAAGIRTLSSEATRFRPNAYHNGNSWPWDTYSVAAGMRRHGRRADADDLAARIMAGYLTTGYFPEFYSGDGAPSPHVNDLVADVVDNTGRTNRICQPPQEVQAWTAAAVLAVKRWRTPGRIGG